MIARCLRPLHRAASTSLICTAPSLSTAQFLALARSRQPPLNDGTTALTALIVGSTIHVANGACTACAPAAAWEV